MSPRAPREPSRLDLLALAALLREQEGVVSRRQIRALGGGDREIARMLRRGEWVSMHPGVYMNHTGLPTWEQRAWAAVLVHLAGCAGS